MAKTQNKGNGDGAGPIDVMRIMEEAVEVAIIGRSPMILNSMSEKAKHELFSPSAKKTSVEKATIAKHNPIQEYRDSMFCLPDGRLTRLYFPANWIKASIRNVAVDLPGVERTKIGRWTWIVGDTISLYGVPQLKIDTVKSAGFPKTPDMRTRAILPQWCARFEVAFAKPMLNPKKIADLIQNVGILIGLGDYRREKGAGNYGGFDIIDPSDKEYAAIVKAGGVNPQDKAIETPEYYDDESRKMFEWHRDDVESRGLRLA